MKITKSTASKIALSVVGLGAVAAVGLSTVPTVLAQGPDEGRIALVQLIAEKFGLNQDEVQTVFDEHHQAMEEQRQQEMQQGLEEKLAQAVTDGKITEEQKQAVLEKHQWVRSQMEALKDLDEEERHVKMDEIREQVKTWAEENGIDLSEIIIFGEGPRGGHGGPMGRPEDRPEGGPQDATDSEQ